MKYIDYIPIKENDLNDRLVNLYGSHLVKLYEAIEPLFNGNSILKPALPLLLELNDDKSYENADIRIMVFGRETNNWNDIKERSYCPFGTYNFEITTSEDVLNEIKGKHIDGEPEIYGICDIYHAYCYEANGVGKTAFTRRKDQLIQQLKERIGNQKIEAIWNNVSKIGCGGTDFGRSCRKPTAEIRDIERKYFNVIAEEIKILKPNIILFLTGFGADKEIKEIFGVSDTDFHSVKEGLFLDRIEIPEVKYAARTIHPSRQSKENLAKHFDTLVEDIVSVIK